MFKCRGACYIVMCVLCGIASQLKRGISPDSVQGVLSGMRPARCAIWPKTCSGVWVFLISCMLADSSRFDRRCPCLLHINGRWAYAGALSPRSR